MLDALPSRRTPNLFDLTLRLKPKRRHHRATAAADPHLRLAVAPTQTPQAAAVAPSSRQHLVAPPRGSPAYRSKGVPGTSARTIPGKEAKKDGGVEHEELGNVDEQQRLAGDRCGASADPAIAAQSDAAPSAGRLRVAGLVRDPVGTTDRVRAEAPHQAQLDVTVAIRLPPHCVLV
jgi:hypothetical protein